MLQALMPSLGLHVRFRVNNGPQPRNTGTSGLLPTPDIQGRSRHVRKGPIVLKKSSVALVDVR
jgi:hypothetical protein